MTLNAKLDALALLEAAAHREGELGVDDDAWWACADVAMPALPELLAVARATIEEELVIRRCASAGLLNDEETEGAAVLHAALANLEDKL